MKSISTATTIVFEQYLQSSPIKLRKCTVQLDRISQKRSSSEALQHPQTPQNPVPSRRCNVKLDHIFEKTQFDRKSTTGVKKRLFEQIAGQNYNLRRRKYT
jgi:hypothetical protein